MPIIKSCFISYRQLDVPYYADKVDEFYEVLKWQIRLAMVPFLEPYVEPRSDASFVRPSVAHTLCTSACMVLLYVPPYFDLSYTDCAREYLAMEELEAQRMAMTGFTNKRTHGLIIPVVLHGWERFPAHIDRERTCYNFAPYMLGGGKLRKSKKAMLLVTKIANYIVARSLELAAVQPDPCLVCDDGFDYPGNARALPWLTMITSSATTQRSEFPRA